MAIGVLLSVMMSLSIFCRHNHPLSNLANNEYKAMGSESVDVVKENMTKNTSHLTTSEAVTSFSWGSLAEGDTEAVEDMNKVLP